MRTNYKIILFSDIKIQKIIQQIINALEKII